MANNNGNAICKLLVSEAELKLQVSVKGEQNRRIVKVWKASVNSLLD